MFGFRVCVVVNNLDSRVFRLYTIFCVYTVYMCIYWYISCDDIPSCDISCDDISADDIVCASVCISADDIV